MPGTGLKRTENSLSRTPRKRRAGSCSENTEKNYTPKASSIISTTREPAKPVKDTASTLDRPGSSTSSTEIGTSATSSLSLATTEKKITLKEPDSEKGTALTPKRQSYDLVSTVNKSTPKGDSFVDAEKKVTSRTPRTRKSSACIENPKKGTPCTPRPRRSSACLENPKKGTPCTPRTRKSSGCIENPKKSTPCTPTRTSPRFSSTGNKQTG